MPSAVSKDLFGHEAVSPLPLGEGEGFFPRPAGTLTPRPLPWGEDATGPSLPCPKRLPDCALGLDSQQQARFVVYREILRVLPAAVPAPHLVGIGAASGLAGTVGPALTGAATGAWAGRVGGLWGVITGALGGAGVGALGAVGHQVQQVTDALTWLVRLAAFLVWFGPSIMGLVQLVLVSLFPLVLLWALIPQTQFQPLAHYVVALLFVFSVPLFWALIDQAQKLAGAAAQPTAPSVLGLGTLQAAVWSSMVTILGLLVVPLVCGLLFFAAFRAVGSLWRGGVR